MPTIQSLKSKVHGRPDHALAATSNFNSFESLQLIGTIMTDKTNGSFQLEEATIADLHDAIRAGKTTVVQVVQRYIDRARAYNGVACLLLTEDGANVPEATGAVRAKT